MGGKDSILVCADADLDTAVEGVVASAFGFSGQKCSACSRAIIEAPIYDLFVERVREKVEQWTVGDPTQNSPMGPVINQGALESMLGYIEAGKKEGRLVAGGKTVTTPEGGYFLEPTVFADIAPDAVIAQEEIFGPVLALIKVDSFEEGLKVANNTEYGLTGALYTDDRNRLAIARTEFHVGNLYFNRKCTGAMVGAHPFGGFNMSGTDSKAGGPDYLYLFTQAKSVAEKLNTKPAPTGI
jgi:1-pyrroline-5-carboxylate dehydrogenase